MRNQRLTRVDSLALLMVPARRAALLKNAATMSGTMGGISQASAKLTAICRTT